MTSNLQAKEIVEDLKTSREYFQSEMNKYFDLWGRTVGELSRLDEIIEDQRKKIKWYQEREFLLQNDINSLIDRLPESQRMPVTMKTFYIFYTWNDNEHKGMAISTSNNRENAVRGFDKKMNVKVIDAEDEVNNYHVWWSEELVLTEEEQVIFA